MTETFREHDVVELVHDLPAEGLAAGDTGTIVGIWGDHRAYEVEFMSGETTIAVLTLEAESIRPHARGVEQ